MRVLHINPKVVGQTCETMEAGLFTFMVADPTYKVSDYSVTIDWGDGQTSGGEVTENGGKGVMLLKGKHVYSSDGDYKIKVKISNSGATYHTVTLDANIVEGGEKHGINIATVKDVETGYIPLAAYCGVAWVTAEAVNNQSAEKQYGEILVHDDEAFEITFRDLEGQNVNLEVTVEDFLGDFIPDEHLSSFEAIFHWSDGQRTTGTITPVDDEETFGKFTVSSNHQFEPEEGEDEDDKRAVRITFEGNLLPSRRSTVDWGDGTESDGKFRITPHEHHHEGGGEEPEGQSWDTFVLGSHKYDNADDHDLLVKVYHQNQLIDEFDPEQEGYDWLYDAGNRTTDLTHGELGQWGQATVALNTGSLRLFHGLDFDLSPGTSVGGSPMLVYNTDTVNPRPIIEGSLYDKMDDPDVTGLIAQLTWAGDPSQENTSFVGQAHEDKDGFVIADQVIHKISENGMYFWRFHVRAEMPGSLAPIDVELEGWAKVVVDASPSQNDEFGPGWSVAGIDKLTLKETEQTGEDEVADETFLSHVYQEEDLQGVLLVLGGGESVFFEKNDDETYESPKGEFGEFTKLEDDTYEYKAKFGMRQKFNTDGMLTKIIDTHDLTITYTYENGRIKTVDTPDGARSTFTYSQTSKLLTGLETPGRTPMVFTRNGVDLEKIKDPTRTEETKDVAAERTFKYDDQHRITHDEWLPYSVTFTFDPDHHRLQKIDFDHGTAYEFLPEAIRGLIGDPDNKDNVVLASEAMADVKDGRNLHTKKDLDLRGRILKLEAPGEIKETWTRDQEDKIWTHTDSLKNTTTYEYDPDWGNLKNITYADKASESFEYHPDFHKLTKHTDARKHIWVNKYNDQGDLTDEIDPLGNTTHYKWIGGLLDHIQNPRKYITSFTYDGHRRLQTVVDALTQTTTHAYDPRGNEKSIQDPLGRIVTTTYDANNQLIAQEDYSGDKWKWQYKPSGLVEKEGDPQVIFMDPSLNLLGTTYEYDSRGFLTELTTFPNSKNARTTKFEYDEIGRNRITTDYRGKQTITNYDDQNRTQTLTNAVKASTVTTFDQNGNMVEIKDANGNRTTYAYDSRNRATTIIDSKLQNTIMEYYEDGKLKVLKDRRNNSTQYQYYPNGQLLKEIDPYSKEHSFEYNPNGSLSKETNERGYSKTYEYDALERLEHSVDESFNKTTYQYNKVGDISKIFDPRSDKMFTVIDHDYYKNITTITEPTDPDNPIVRRQQVHNFRTSLGLVTATEDGKGKSQLVYQDVYGRPIKLVDENGLITSITYDDAENSRTEEDPRHNKTTYYYNDIGQLAEVQNALSERTVMIYDPVGNLSEVRDARYHTTTFHYDSLNRKSKMIDPLLHETSYLYDQEGNVTYTLDSEGRYKKYEYDKLNRLTDEIVGESKDPLYSQHYEYDGVGNLIELRNGNNHTTKYSYTPNNLLDSITAPKETADSKNAVTVYGYDKNGNQNSITNPLGAVWTKNYDGANRLVSETDPLGHITKYKYDQTGRLEVKTDARNHEWKYTYYDNGLLKTELTPNKLETVYLYDDSGNLQQTNKPSLPGAVTTYDKLNRKKRVVDQNGRATQFDYDAAGNLAEVIENHDTKEALSTGYQYDYLNHMTTITTWRGIVVQGYDASGNMTSVTDEQQRTTSYTYDLANRRTHVKTPDLVINESVYDDANNLIEEKSRQNADVTNVTKYQYDASERLTTITDSRQKTTTFSYDPAGRLDGTTDRLGRAQVIQYDAADRQTTVVWQHNGVPQKTFGFAYDSANNLTTATNDLGTVVIGYDHSNRIETIRDVANVTLSYSYDQAGRRDSITDNQGGSIKTTFKPNSQTGSHELTASGKTAKVDVEYDARDRPATITYATGSLDNDKKIVHTYEYNNGNQTKSINSKAVSANPTTDGGDTIESIAYDYYSTGQLQRESRSAYRTRSDPGVVGVSGQLNPNLTYRVSYFYDSKDQLTTIHYDGGFPYVRTYDNSGNVSSITQNNTTSQSVVDPGNRVRFENGWVLEYDDEGNLTKRKKETPSQPDPFGETWSYEYDFENRLTNVKGYRARNGAMALEANITYSYDALGRYSKREAVIDNLWLNGPAGMSTTYFTRIDNQVYAESGSDLQIDTRFLRADGSGQLFARIDAQYNGNLTSPFWYITDRQGSVIDIMDSNGYAVKRLRYEPFGSAPSFMVSFDDNVRDFYQYRGFDTDPETGPGDYSGKYGLQIIESKAYDPFLGRWMSNDIVSQANPYKFEENNPNKTEVVAPPSEFNKLLGKFGKSLIRSKAPLLSLAMNTEFLYHSFVHDSSLDESANVAGMQTLEHEMSDERFGGRIKMLPKAIVNGVPQGIVQFASLGYASLPTLWEPTKEEEARGYHAMEMTFSIATHVYLGIASAMVGSGAFVKCASTLQKAIRGTAFAYDMAWSGKTMADGYQNGSPLQFGLGALGLISSAALARMAYKAVGCFGAGTPLLTPEGSKPIEQFQAGDLVLSRDENDPNGPIVPKLVEEVFERTAQITKLVIQGQTIATTGEHPFYAEGQEWVAAQDLKIGDRLLTLDGQWVKVEALIVTDEWHSVYNLRVADCHTYFVGCDRWGWSVWAHNTTCVNPQAISEIARVKGTIKDWTARVMRNKGEAKAIEYLAKARDLSGNLVGVEKARLAIEASKIPVVLGDSTKAAQAANILGAQYEADLAAAIAAGGNKPFFRPPRRGGIDIGSLEGQSIIINEAKLVTPPNHLQFDDFTAITTNLRSNLSEVLTHVHNPGLTPLLTPTERVSVIATLDTFLTGKGVPANLSIRVSVKTPGGVIADVIGPATQIKVGKHASGIPVRFVQG